MGWKCIDELCSMKYFSIADEIRQIVKGIVDLMFNMAPGVYAILILILIATFILYMFYYIKRIIRMDDAE
jgi:hypothetical protein